MNTFGARNSYAASVRKTAESVLYYVAVYLYLLQGLLECVEFSIGLTSLVGPARSIMQAVTLALLATKLLIQKYTQEQIALIVLMIAAAGVFMLSGSSRAVAMLLAFAIAGKGTNIKSIAKSSLAACLTILVIAVGGYFAGFTLSTNYGSSVLVLDRHSLGFRHPNTFGLVGFAICVDYYIYRGRQGTIASIVMCIAVIAVDIIVIGSRTSLLLVALTLLLIAGFPIIEKNSHRSLILCASIIAVVSLLSLYFTLLYDAGNPIHQRLDNLLSRRLSLAHNYYVLYPPGIIGNSIDIAALERMGFFLVDNAFAHSLIQYGWLPYSVLMVVMIAIFHKAFKEDYAGIIVCILTLFAIAGFSENVTFTIRHDIALFALSALLFSSPLTVFDGMRT